MGSGPFWLDPIAVRYGALGRATPKRWSYQWTDVIIRGLCTPLPDSVLALASFFATLNTALGGVLDGGVLDRQSSKSVCASLLASTTSW
jgi:hypothetical protein